MDHIRDFNEDIFLRRIFWPKCLISSQSFSDASKDEITYAAKILIEEAMHDSQICLNQLKNLNGHFIFRFLSLPWILAHVVLEKCQKFPERIYDSEIKLEKNQFSYLYPLAMNFSNLKEIDQVRLRHF